MKVTATVLVENSVLVGRDLVGEHGWAVFLETEGGNFLLDTGQGNAIINNARLLRKDLSSVKGIILSHHHYDHTGGLIQALEHIGPVDVYAHPDLFKKSYLRRKGEEEQYIGIPFTQEELEEKGARFRFDKGWQELIPGLYITGEVPRTTSFETGPADMFCKENDAYIKDSLLDDQSLALVTEQGLSVILGCAHAGIINTLQYCMEKTGCRQVNIVMGGTHLGPQDQATKEQSIQALKELTIKRIGGSHCTGLPTSARLATEFGERFFFASVGTVVQL